MTGLIRDVASHAGPDTGASRFRKRQIAHPVVVAPEVQGPLHHNIRVEELRETDAGPNHIEHFLDELARSLRGKRNRERRLGQCEIERGIENHVVHFRRGIATVLGITRKGDTLSQVGGVRLGDSLAIVVVDLIQLDGEVLEHEDRVFIGDESGRLVGLIERLKVLTQIGLGVPAADLLKFCNDVTEEVTLDGLPQVAGGILGNPLAGFGEGDQLRFAGCVLLLRRHFTSQLGIAMGIADRRPHHDEGCLIEVELGEVRHPHLEGHLPLLHLLDHAGKALAVNPRVVQVATAGRPVMERGDQAGVVTGFRVVAKALLKDGFGAEFHPTRAPVVDRPLVRRLVFRRRRVFDRLLLDHPIHLPFGIGVERVEFACHGADKEVVVDIQFLALQDGSQEFGALEERMIARGFFVHLAHDPDSLEVEILRSAPAAVPSVGRCVRHQRQLWR